MSAPLLAGLARLSEMTAGIDDSEQLLDALLDGLARELGVFGAFVLLADETAERLYTVASRGYPSSGIGSEVRIGEGVFGTAAAQRRPVRIQNLKRALHYGQALAERAREAGHDVKEIPLPTIEGQQSVLAVPLCSQGNLVGILAVQSAKPSAFSEEVEHALVVVAALVAERLAALAVGMPEAVAERAPPAPPSNSALSSVDVTPVSPIRVRHYAEDDSVFFDHDYVIKGVAGRIFWRVLRENEASGRTEFSNKELRLEVGSKLGWARDNLESRLILLRKRLAEKRCGVSLSRAGRGRFRLEKSRSLVLEEG